MHCFLATALSLAALAAATGCMSPPKYPCTGDMPASGKLTTVVKLPKMLA